MLWALLYLRIYQNCESFIETWLIIIIKHRQWGESVYRCQKSIRSDYPCRLYLETARISASKARVNMISIPMDFQISTAILPETT